MTREEIEQKISAFFIETLEFDASLIKSDASLRNDIGISSLDAVELRLFIQRTFGWQPTRDDMLSVVTLNDLFSIVEQHIS